MISWLFHLEDRELALKKIEPATIWLIVVIALAIFLLHFTEIALFAGLYLLLDAAPTVEEALLFSMASYTTAGSTVVHLDEAWQLLGITEALTGFLLIGWSTAYLVAKLRKVES